MCVRCIWDEVSSSSSKILSMARPTPRSRFLVPISSFAPSASLLASLILARIERRFPSSVFLAVPSFYETPELKNKPANLSVLRFRISPPPPSTADVISCIRYDRAWAVRAASIVGADIIVLPLARTDLTAVLLEALLTGKPEASFDSQAHLVVGERKLVNLFAYIERETVAALEYVESLDLKAACMPVIITKPVLFSIIGAPERDYGALEITPRFVQAIRRPYICRACGAPSSSSLCGYCSRLGLAELSVAQIGETQRAPTCPG
ncbi:MAG: hypothetical protein ACP5HK_00515 [Acidilobus sp.]